VAQAPQGVQEVNETVAESTLAVDDSAHTLSRLAEELNRLVGCFRV
jgi:methyl-accepting chemotaxis protein